LGFKGNVLDGGGRLTKEAKNFYDANLGGRSQKNSFAENQTIFKNLKYDNRIKQEISTDVATIRSSEVDITFKEYNREKKDFRSYTRTFSYSEKEFGPSHVSYGIEDKFFKKKVPYGKDGWDVDERKRVLEHFKKYMEDYNSVITDIVMRDAKVFKTKRTTKGISVLNIKLLHAIPIGIDGLREKETWNTGKNTCVFDFINHYFKNSRINKKFIKEEFFNQLFPKWKDIGISAEEIKKWCAAAGVNMLALNKEEKLILKYYAGDKSKKSTLCFIVHNDHMYGFTDKYKIKIFADKFRDLNPEMRRGGGGRERKEPLAGKDYKTVEIEITNSNLSTTEYLVNFMHTNNIEIKNKNIKSKNGKIYMFICDDMKTKFIFDDGKGDVVKNYFKAENKEYTGQSSSSFVYEAMEKAQFDISTPNPILREFFDTKHMKDMVQHGYYGDNKDSTLTRDIEKGVLRSFDINKCHTSIIENPSEEWIIFDFDARIENYDGGEIVLGLYYVEADDKNLFTGNKLYASHVIKYGLQNNIILKSNIKKFIKASRSKPKSYLRDISESYNEVVNMENPHAKAMLKLLNNSTGGILGKHKSSRENVKISTSEEEAFMWLGSHIDDDIYVHEMVRGDKKFYIYGSKTTTLMEKTNIPMYIQILGEQLVKLHKAIVLATGNDFSRLVYRKVDSFTIRGEPVDSSFITDSRGGFSKDIVPTIDSTRNHPHKNIVVDWTKYQLDWDIDLKIKTSNDYEILFDYVEQKKSLNIQGRAGFGKTYMIDKLISEYGEDSVIRMAFTNCAAVRIGGKTIHSTLKFSFSNRSGVISEKVLESLANNKKIRCIIIDEQGTLDASLWNLVSQLKKRIKVSFLLFGDFFQLGPVDNKLYFENEIVKLISDRNMCELKYHSRCRHDEKLHSELEKIRSSDKKKPNLSAFKTATGSQIKDFKTHICFTNERCFDINELCADAMFSETGTSKVYLDDMIGRLKSFNDKIPDIPSKDFMGVCVGMPILCKANNSGKKYFNGERFHILDIKQNDEITDIITDPKVNYKTKEFAKTFLSVITLTIKSEIDSGKIIDISTYNFLMDFDIGFAMTNHKIIGATIVEDFLIHQTDFYYADARWIYTALSRAKSISQVYLLR
jgi:hypothetical protein